MNQDINDFVLDLIHRHGGMDEAVKFVQKKLFALQNDFDFEIDSHQTIEFWRMVKTELHNRIQMN